MDTKLTLKLDKAVIEKAKIYASSHKKSLSRLIESYLKSLTDTELPDSPNEITISPFVKSMQSGVEIPADVDYKKKYRKHVAEKYK